MLWVQNSSSFIKNVAREVNASIIEKSKTLQFIIYEGVFIEDLLMIYQFY